MLARLRPWVWLLAFVLLCVAAYRTQIHREMADFHVYRVAGERVWQAEPLYRDADGHYQFKYLPAFALAMAPLALVDAELATALWFSISAALLVVFLFGSVRALPERRRSAVALRWLTALFMLKFYAHELTLGQMNLLLGTLLLGGLVAVQHGRPLVAGALVGVAVFVKPYAVILLPWLLVSSGAAATMVAAGTGAVGLLLPAVVYGWSGNLELLLAWYRTVTGSTSGNLLGADNVSMAAMWAKWIGVGAPASVLAVTTLGGVFGLVTAIWRRRRAVTSPDYLEYALLMLLIPLVSPQGWDYVLLLGTPAVVCVLDRWPDLDGPWRGASLALLALMGLTVFDLMGRALYGQFMAWSIVTVAALGLVVVLAHLRWRALA